MTTPKGEVEQVKIAFLMSEQLPASREKLNIQQKNPIFKISSHGKIFFHFSNVKYKLFYSEVLYFHQ